MDSLIYGLKEVTIQQICDIFSTFPQIEDVILYGSRAMETYRNGSDIDMTLTGETLTHNDINRISLRLDDLFLPYQFDLSLLKEIKNPDLIDHIRRVGKLFYKKTGVGIPDCISPV